MSSGNNMEYYWMYNNWQNYNTKKYYQGEDLSNPQLNRMENRNYPRRPVRTQIPLKPQTYNTYDGRLRDRSTPQHNRYDFRQRPRTPRGRGSYNRTPRDTNPSVFQSTSSGGSPPRNLSMKEAARPKSCNPLREEAADIETSKEILEDLSQRPKSVNIDLISMEISDASNSSIEMNDSVLKDKTEKISETKEDSYFDKLYKSKSCSEMKSDSNISLNTLNTMSTFLKQDKVAAAPELKSKAYQRRQSVDVRIKSAQLMLMVADDTGGDSAPISKQLLETTSSVDLCVTASNVNKPKIKPTPLLQEVPSKLILKPELKTSDSAIMHIRLHTNVKDLPKIEGEKSNSSESKPPTECKINSEIKSAEAKKNVSKSLKRRDSKARRRSSVNDSNQRSKPAETEKSTKKRSESLKIFPNKKDVDPKRRSSTERKEAKHSRRISKDREKKSEEVDAKTKRWRPRRRNVIKDSDSDIDMKDKIDIFIKESKRIYGSNAKEKKKRKSIDSICTEDSDDSTNKKLKCDDAKKDDKMQRNLEVILERIDSKSFQKIREKQSRGYGVHVNDESNEPKISTDDLLSTLTGEDDINLDEILITNLQEKEVTGQHEMEFLLEDDSNDAVDEHRLLNEDEEQIETSCNDNKSVLNGETSLPGESEHKTSEPIKESGDFYDKKSVPRKDESVSKNSCSEVEDKACSPNVDEHTKCSWTADEDSAVKNSVNTVEKKISSPSVEENSISVVESLRNEESVLKDTSGGINDSLSKESAHKDKNITDSTSTDKEKKISDTVCEDELTDKPTDASEETANALAKQVTLTTLEVFNANELREIKETTLDEISDSHKEYINKFFSTDPQMWKYFCGKDGTIELCNYNDFHKIFFPLFQNIHLKTQLLQMTDKWKCIFQEEARKRTLIYKEIIRSLNLLHSFLKNIDIIDFEFEKVLRNIIEFEKYDYRYTMVGMMLLVAQMKTVHTSFGKLFFNSLVDRCCVIARVNQSLYDQAYNILNEADPKMGESLELLLKSKIKLEIKEELAREVVLISDDDDDDCCIVGTVKLEVKEEENKTKSAQSPEPAKEKYVTPVPTENLMNPPPPYTSGNAQPTPEVAVTSTQAETYNAIPGYGAQSSWFPQNIVPTEMTQPEMNNVRYPMFEQSSTECLSRLESMTRQPYDNNFTTPTQQQEVPQQVRSVEEYNYRLNMLYPGARGSSAMTNEQTARSPTRASPQFPPQPELPGNHQLRQNQYPHIPPPPYQPHPNGYTQRYPYNHQTWRATQQQYPHQFPAQSYPQQFSRPAVQQSLDEIKKQFASTAGAADVRLFPQSAQQRQLAESVQYLNQASREAIMHSQIARPQQPVEDATSRPFPQANGLPSRGSWQGTGTSVMDTEHVAVSPQNIARASEPCQIPQVARSSSTDAVEESRQNSRRSSAEDPRLVIAQEGCQQRNVRRSSEDLRHILAQTNEESRRNSTQFVQPLGQNSPLIPPQNITQVPQTVEQLSACIAQQNNPQYAQTVLQNTSRVPMHASQLHQPGKQYPSRISQQNNLQYAQSVGQNTSRLTQQTNVQSIGQNTSRLTQQNNAQSIGQNTSRLTQQNNAQSIGQNTSRLTQQNNAQSIGQNTSRIPPQNITQHSLQNNVQYDKSVGSVPRQSNAQYANQPRARQQNYPQNSPRVSPQSNPQYAQTVGQNTLRIPPQNINQHSPRVSMQNNPQTAGQNTSQPIEQHSPHTSLQNNAQYYQTIAQNAARVPQQPSQPVGQHSSRISLKNNAQYTQTIGQNATRVPQHPQPVGQNSLAQPVGQNSLTQPVGQRQFHPSRVYQQEQASPRVSSTGSSSETPDDGRNARFQYPQKPVTAAPVISQSALHFLLNPQPNMSAQVPVIIPAPQNSNMGVVRIGISPPNVQNMTTPVNPRPPSSESGKSKKQNKKTNRKTRSKEDHAAKSPPFPSLSMPRLSHEELRPAEVPHSISSVVHTNNISDRVTELHIPDSEEDMTQFMENLNNSVVNTPESSRTISNISDMVNNNEVGGWWDTFQKNVSYHNNNPSESAVNCVQVLGMIKIPNPSNEQEKKGRTRKRTLPVRYNPPESDTNQKGDITLVEMDQQGRLPAMGYVNERAVTEIQRAVSSDSGCCVSPSDSSQACVDVAATDPVKALDTTKENNVPHMRSVECICGSIADLVSSGLEQSQADL